MAGATSTADTAACTGGCVVQLTIRYTPRGRTPASRYVPLRCSKTAIAESCSSGLERHPRLGRPRPDLPECILILPLALHQPWGRFSCKS